MLGKATHHSVELSWRPPPHLAEHGRLRYCIQEEDAAKKDGFGTVYKYGSRFCYDSEAQCHTDILSYSNCSGYATSHEFTGLNVLTQYRYRVRAINDVGPGPWSPVVTVATTSECT